MKTFLKTFLADESGASAAEYALILVIIGLGIVAAGSYLGGAITDSLCAAASTIDGANGSVYQTTKPSSCN